MHVAVRPNLAAAGVALVGASVVAASSIAPLPDVHLPDIHAPALVERAFDVSLTAASDPLAAYSQVLQNALAGLNTLISTAQPGQVLSEVLANQSANAAEALAAVGSAGGAVAGALAQAPAALITAAGQLAAGNISGATNTLLQLPLDIALPLTNALPALADLITKPLQNVVNVINAFTSDQLGTMLALSGFIAPLISTPAAAAVAVQNVLAAVATLNPVAIANAVLTAPATVADGLLNGGYGPNLAGLAGLPPDQINVVAGGLLSPTGLSIGDDGSLTINTGGPLAALQQVLAKIAGAITAPAAATVQLAATDATSIPSATPQTVSLASAEAAPTAKPAESKAPATPSTEKDTATSETKADATSADKPAEVKTPEDKASEAPSKDTTTKDTTTKDATTKDTTTDADSTTKPAKDVDVKGGNKVEPTKSVSTDTPKAGDTKLAADTSAAAGESHADSGASASSKDAA